MRKAPDLTASDAPGLEEPAPPTARAGERSRVVRLLVTAAPLVVAIVIVALAIGPTLGFDHVADAQFLIADNRFIDAPGRLWDNLRHDYFWSSSGNLIPYWRPFTKGSWWVEARLFGRAPLAFHAVQVAWHLLGVAGVFAFARRLGARPEAAGAAGVIYGLHPVTIEATSLVMARSDVVAATGVIWALVAWTAIRAGARGWAWWLLHVAALIAALGSKETSVAVLPLLGLWAWADSSPRNRRSSQLLPATLLVAAVLVLRRFVVHATPTLNLDPRHFAVGLGAQLWAALPLRGATGLRVLSQAEARSASVLGFSVLVVAAVVAGGAGAIRRRAWSAVALLGWAVLSIAPVVVAADLSVPMPQGGVALADRWSLHAAAAFAIALAVAVARGRRTVPRAVLPIVTLAWAALTWRSAAHARAMHATDLTLLEVDERDFEATPARFRSDDDRCLAITRRLARAAAAHAADDAERALGEATPACRSKPALRFNLLAARVGAERYALARPDAEALLTAPLEARYGDALVYMVALTRLGTGDPAGAEALLLEARRRGNATCALSISLAEAATLQGHASVGAAHYDDAFACNARQRSRDVAILLVAGHWHLVGGDLQTARAHLAEARRGALDPRARQLASVLESEISNAERAAPHVP